jgi:Tol biopolymer transport system component
MLHRFTLAVLALALLALALAGPATAKTARNGVIAFESDRDGDGDLYTVKPNGKHVKRLTKNTIDDSDPRFSANGKQVVFERTYDGETDAEVVRLSLKTGKEKRLTKDDFEQGDPQFTPDGKRIVYLSEEDGDSDIFSMKAKNGKDAVNLTNNTVGDWDPSVSPDGKRIAYCFEANMTQLQVATIKIDGSGFNQLTDAMMGSSNEPEWAPNGKVLAIESDASLDPTSMIMDDEIFTIDAKDGSDPKQLTESPSFADDDPDFSPDGKQITFESDRGGTVDVYRMDADGTHEKPVVDDASYDAEPDWQAKRR